MNLTLVITQTHGPGFGCGGFVFMVLSAFLVLGNILTFVGYLVTGKLGSTFPIFGSGILSLSIWSWSSPAVSMWWWIPLVIDPMSLLWAPIWYLRHRRNKAVEAVSTRIKFPLFVRVPDEGCFMRIDTVPSVQHFESQEVRDMEHRAWDSRCDRYRLVPAGSGLIGAVLDACSDREGFERAIEEFERRCAEAGDEKTPRGRCSAAELRGVLDAMTS